MTSMNVDVEGGGTNNSDNHMENNRTQQDEEREEKLLFQLRSPKKVCDWVIRHDVAVS